jgi:hypothetical protein
VDAVSAVVVSSLLAGLGLVVGGWVMSKDWRLALGSVSKNVKWDFSKSWASNLTVFGGVLTAVFAAKILPDQAAVGTTAITPVFATAAGYTSLSLLFSILIVFAPFVFVAIRSIPSGANGYGRGAGLLAACWLTLWAVVGELTTVGLIFYEAFHGQTVSLGVAIAVWIVLGAGVTLLPFYALASIKALLVQKAPAKTPSPSKGGHAGALDNVMDLEIGELVHREAAPAQSWSLL